MNEDTTLIASGITKTYASRGGKLVILRDASLSLDGGESVAITGPSGSGKSTFLNIVGTLETPDAGTVRIAGQDPFTLNTRDLARFRNRTVGFIFQEHYLLPQCNVIENVLIPTLADRQRGGADRTARAEQLLERVGLSHRLDHRPSELSGGERQRVAIARALINQPALLLADEPTGNLDRKTADAIAALLVEMFRHEKLALVVVTHNERLAGRFDRTLELVEGSLKPAP